MSARADVRAAYSKASELERYDMLLDLARQLDEAKDVIAGYEGAITWETSCLNCARLLDQLYEGDMRFERLSELIELSRWLEAENAHWFGEWVAHGGPDKHPPQGKRLYPDAIAQIESALDLAEPWPDRNPVAFP